MNEHNNVEMKKNSSNSIANIKNSQSFGFYKKKTNYLYYTKIIYHKIFHQNQEEYQTILLFQIKTRKMMRLLK